MRRAAAAVLAPLAVLALTAGGGAACGQKNKFIPPGNYSGSDAGHRRFTLDLTRDGVKVNQKKARFTGPGRIEVKQRGTAALRLKCQPQAKGEEVRCVVAFPDHTETIDLMRL